MYFILIQHHDELTNISEIHKLFKWNDLVESILT